MQNRSVGDAELQNSSSTALQVEGLLYSSYVANIVFNGCLCYSTTALNIATIYALRKTVLISKPLRILILNLAASDLAVSLLGQLCISLIWSENYVSRLKTELPLSFRLSSGIYFISLRFAVFWPCMQTDSLLSTCRYDTTILWPANEQLPWSSQYGCLIFFSYRSVFYWPHRELVS